MISTIEVDVPMYGHTFLFHTVGATDLPTLNFVVTMDI
jgi:hypothetical protein